MTLPVRVLVGDSEKIYREGLKLLLSRHSDIRVVGQAASGGELCEKARRIQPDLVLLESVFPDMDGFAATRTILADLPRTRIAMLCVSRADADVLKAIKSGAHGYMTKDTNVHALVDSILRVACGESVVPPSIASRLLQEYAAITQDSDAQQNAIEADRAKVTEREREVLRLLVQGATNRDIARQLVITENTVKVHLRNILEKLHLRNRQQAAAFAVSSGLVRLSQENGKASELPAQPRRAGAPLQEAHRQA